MESTKKRRRWRVPSQVVRLLQPVYRRSWSRKEGEIYVFRLGGTKGRGPVLQAVRMSPQPSFIHRLKHNYRRRQFHRHYG